MYQTNMYEGMLAETITMPGLNNELINAYFVRPAGYRTVPGYSRGAPHARLGRVVPGSDA